MRDRGFSLIEVVLAVGILAGISGMAIVMLSTQMDLRSDLARIEAAQHGLNVALGRLAGDLTQLYLPSKQEELDSRAADRPVRPSLVAKPGDIVFSTLGLLPSTRDEPAGGSAMVRYYVRDDPKDTRIRQLIRATDTVFKEPLGTRDTGVEQVLLGDLKECILGFWNGQDYVDSWSTLAGDTARILPKLVRVRLVSFLPLSDKQLQLDELQGTARERNTLVAETTVYILASAGQPNLREVSK